jgi:hypothetical protein
MTKAKEAVSQSPDGDSGRRRRRRRVPRLRDVVARRPQFGKAIAGLKADSLIAEKRLMFVQARVGEIRDNLEVWDTKKIVTQLDRVNDRLAVLARYVHVLRDYASRAMSNEQAAAAKRLKEGAEGRERVIVSARRFLNSGRDRRQVVGLVAEYTRFGKTHVRNILKKARIL